MFHTRISKKSAAAIFFRTAEKFFVAAWQIIKTIFGALLILFEKILRFIVELILALAKILRALALIFTAIFAALALLALAFFLVSRAVDLPNSENFQKIRERSFEIGAEWLEPEFTASEARAAAWSEYRAELQRIHAADISNSEKEELVEQARTERDKKLLSAGTIWILR
jgi:hypothetical protein